MLLASSTQGGETAPTRSVRDSHVRLRPLPFAGRITWLDARLLLDELDGEARALSLQLVPLGSASHGAPRDPSARAALLAVEERARGLEVLRDALAEVQRLAHDPRVHRILGADAPLPEYLRGLYAWAHAVTRVLDGLVGSLRCLTVDWAVVRARLDAAKDLRFEELHPAIRRDVAALGDASLARAVQRLFAAGEALEVSLDRRFG